MTSSWGEVGALSLQLPDMRTRQSDRDHVDDAYVHEDASHKGHQAQPSRRDLGPGALDSRKHDSFAGSFAANAVTELEAAVAEPAVLAQPTPALAAVLRTATKVICRCAIPARNSDRCQPECASMMDCSCACVDGLRHACGHIVYTPACTYTVTLCDIGADQDAAEGDCYNGH